jgi:5-dehydro-2-deoxygluconokinase
LKRLYILPFDHRATFQSNMFGWKGTLTSAQSEAITAAKRLIYDGFKAALEAGVPKEKAGILVDEQFGSEILRDATRNGFSTAYTVEKSGQGFGNDVGYQNTASRTRTGTRHRGDISTR